MSAGATAEVADPQSLSSKSDPISESWLGGQAWVVSKVTSALMRTWLPALCHGYR